jgi:hypothetical protein
MKGKPIFNCSKWTAIQMLKDGNPHSTFAVHLSIFNKGKVPLQIFDFLLKAKTNKGQILDFEPILLWDLRQWIEDGDRPDKVGRAQKGQVSLPLIITPGQLYDFGYHILFLPVDKLNLIKPISSDGVELTLYSKTDRAANYELIGKQSFTDKEMKEILQKSFVSVISTEAISERQKILEKNSN